MTEYEPVVAPFGSWESPISSDHVVDARGSLSELFVDGNNVFWLESRPTEGGRTCIMTTDYVRHSGVAREVAGAADVRTMVYEYGGAPALAVEDMLYFVNAKDQRIYALNFEAEGNKPFPITPDNYRYADFIFVKDSLIAVREDRTERPPVHCLVSINLVSFEQTIVAHGKDFYSSPRVDRKQEKLAYLAWDHPNMPWDSTELWVMDLETRTHSRVAGGEEVESILEPLWSPKGILYFISDRVSGWWNIHRIFNDKVEKVYEIAAEVGGAAWTLGRKHYAFLDEDKIICDVNFREGGRLIVFDIPRKIQMRLNSEYCSHEYLSVTEDANFVYFIGSSLIKPRAVVRMEISADFHATGKAHVTQDVLHLPAHFQELRMMYELPCDVSYISRAQVVEFKTKDLVFGYGYYYEPHNPRYTPDQHELPPVLVRIHGGPTSSTSSAFSLEFQYWTTRGFAIFDVNYGGSTGYGRAYRERLYGRWGEVDVHDACSGVEYLVSMGWVDPNRLCIDGESAGGYTTLACLTFTKTFKAGASLYGVADCEALALDTHKFESHYLDNLIGKYPATKDVYRARSPIHHVQKLEVPLILFQGDEDAIVPPGQAVMMYEAVKKKGLPVSLNIFKGEHHGFLKGENIKKTLEGEYYFFCKVFGIKPNGVKDGIVVIDNLHE